MSRAKRTRDVTRRCHHRLVRLLLYAYIGLQTLGDTVSADNDAGGHCFSADELE